MKKSRSTESPIVALLKEGEAGVGIAQLARKKELEAAGRSVDCCQQPPMKLPHL